MDAKKCDRCGCFYNFEYYQHFKVFSYRNKAFHQELDLCKNCAKDFEKWLKEVKTNEVTE